MPVKITMTSKTGHFTFQTLESREPENSLLELIEFPLQDASFVPIDEWRLRVTLTKPLRFRLFTGLGDLYADRALKSFIIQVRPRHQDIISQLYPGRIMAFDLNVRDKMVALLDEFQTKGASWMAQQEVTTGLPRPKLRTAEVLSFNIDVENLGTREGVEVFGFSILGRAYAEITLTSIGEQQVVPVSIRRVTTLFEENDPILDEYKKWILQSQHILRTQIQRGWIDGYQTSSKNMRQKSGPNRDQENVVELQEFRSCRNFFISN